MSWKGFILWWIRGSPVPLSTVMCSLCLSVSACDLVFTFVYSRFGWTASLMVQRDHCVGVFISFSNNFNSFKSQGTVNILRLVF